jgi:predicted RNA-binding Zn ribbon-like protein
VIVMLPMLPDRTPHVVGSRLCLALVNTVLWRRSEAPVERLQSYPDLVATVGGAGWLESPDALLKEAVAHPRLARTALAAAIDLREMLFPLLSDIAAGAVPTASDLKPLNSHLNVSLGHVRVADSGDGLTPTWWPENDLDLPVWQVAASAGAVVTSDDRDRLKQCPGEQCGWLFVDESSNQSRRWCDSRLCGNRARVRAHYERSRNAG